jgi:hypothetical protein
MTTSAPASANPRAIALPKPLFPPVTRVHLPVKSNSGDGTVGILMRVQRKEEGVILRQNQSKLKQKTQYHLNRSIECIVIHQTATVSGPFEFRGLMMQRPRRPDPAPS